MAVLGTLLRNKRPDERTHAWNLANLHAPDTLEITSRDFVDGAAMPAPHWGRRVGGQNLSPHLAWSPPPAGTEQLLVLIEDLDAPIGSNPAVHCLAVIDETALRTPYELASGALSKNTPDPGVTLLRSIFSRGYYGPEPLKGHGPHRYVFQIYALGRSLLTQSDRDALLKTRPRAVLTSVSTPILARGRITSVCER
jgi:phosphatidylethanolamine-binding protein (PEBP) family uncharacterized protein